MTGGQGGERWTKEGGVRALGRLVVCLSLLLAACGQDEAPTATDGKESSPEATETTSEPQALQTGGPTGRALLPGTYTTARFEPKVTFTLEDRPGARSDLPDILSLGKDQNAFFSLFKPSEVIDPNTQEPVAVPADLLAWLQSNPNLEVGEPTPATIGGVTGTQLDITG